MMPSMAERHLFRLFPTSFGSPGLIAMGLLSALASPAFGEEQTAEAAGGTFAQIDAFAGSVAGFIAKYLFYDIYGFPFIVLWLISGAVFLTLRMGFVNLWGLKHAVMLTAGKYDDPTDVGEVSHFQALTTALSATVGLGNIAGVAVAVSVGGPGATFWMIVAGFLGMTSKMVECTLGQMYRHIRQDGHIMGGAMYYLSQGLADIGLGPLGKVLSLLFCILCIGASFGGGNAFQVNQSLNGIVHSIPMLKGNEWMYGAIMVVLTASVILGGIKRIAGTADKLVPAMCVIYVIAGLWILGINSTRVPDAFWSIINGAFSPGAVGGGIIGVIVTGFKRASFSNEAGIGSAAIAHSAAKTNFPVREGLVALLEPFIDTIVICTMTALIIVITGAWNNPEYQHYISDQAGAALTGAAMGEQIAFFPYVLSLSVFLFAFSTIISWSYYGERCWAYLFGDNSSIVYKILFLICTFLGAVVSPKNILELSDLAILSMAFPNMLGLFLLHGKVRRALLDYWKLYKAGEFDRKPKG